MACLLRIPHGFLRRHLASVERLIVSAALAGLCYAGMHALPAYPLYWDAVITAGVFIATLAAPGVGYLLAVAALIYPLYNLSLYLMVLFLALALLGMRLFSNNLGATLLALAAPWLAPVYLAWSVPVLGGLWWGVGGGALIGGLAALWGQLLAGMAGLPPDWLARLGAEQEVSFAPRAAAVIQRFGETDSLQTLLRLLEPLSPDSTTLLYHLLQVVVWAGLGALVGFLAERDWAYKHHPWAAMVVAWLGAALLPVSHAALGLWLGVFSSADVAALWPSLLLSFLLTGLLCSLLEGLQDLLEHPLPIPLRPSASRRDVYQAAAPGGRRVRRTPQPSQTAGEARWRAGASPPDVPIRETNGEAQISSSQIGDSSPPADKNSSSDDDLIMLELD